MQVWIDADACPIVIKEILFRAAERTRIQMTLVAHQSMRLPSSQFVRLVQVPAGFNAADRRIIELCGPGDLVITADIPLAAAVVAKGALALDPRGDLYTDRNITDRLATRNLMEDLRGGGMVSGGPPPLTLRERQAFANQLDKYLASCGNEVPH